MREAHGRCLIELHGRTHRHRMPCPARLRHARYHASVDVIEVIAGHRSVFGLLFVLHPPILKPDLDLTFC